MSNLFCYICSSKSHPTYECFPTPRIDKSFCYICFSKYHSLNDCIYAVPNLFLPNIDQHLFARFLELLVIEEKLLLMFTYPRIFNSIVIKPVEIRDPCAFDLPCQQKFLEADLILAKKAKVQSSFFSDIKSRIAFRVEHLEIISWLKPPFKLFYKELFLLCTFKTKILKCKNVEFHPTVNLRQIVEAAPALEEIDIYESNIEADKTWVDSLNRLQNLKTVYLAIPDLYINVANLAAVIEANNKNLHIHLFIIIHQKRYTFDYNPAFQFVTNQLSSHFELTQFLGSKTCITVSFKFNDGILSSIYSHHYDLKNL